MRPAPPPGDPGLTQSRLLPRVRAEVEGSPSEAKRRCVPTARGPIVRTDGTVAKEFQTDGFETDRDGNRGPGSPEPRRCRNRRGRGARPTAGGGGAGGR